MGSRGKILDELYDMRKLSRKSRWLKLAAGVGLTNTNTITQENKTQSWVLKNWKIFWFPVATPGAIASSIISVGTFPSLQLWKWLLKGFLIPPTFWVKISPESYNMNLHQLFHDVRLSISGKESKYLKRLEKSF